MRRWIAGREPPSINNPSTTENPRPDSCSRGKWLLRSTKIRQARENNEKATPKPPVTNPLKRKQRNQSPTPSAHSSTSENSIQLPTMERRNNVGMWSYATTEKFVEILLQEANKEQSTNTRKTRVFNAHQWKAVHKEFERVTERQGYSLKQLKDKYTRLKAEYRLWEDLMTHTGKGWDDVRQTVTFDEEVWSELLKRNKDYDKFRERPIDHREMLEELFQGSLATGTFANPSTCGASSSEEDRQKYGPPRTVRRGEASSMGGKRKSEGSGGSVTKQKKGEEKNEAYDRVAKSNEVKADFYKRLIDSNIEASSSSIDACVAALGDVKDSVKPMSSSSIPPPNIPENYFSDGDEDLIDLEFLDLDIEDDFGKMPQRTSEQSGQAYVNFLLDGHPRTIRDILRVDAFTFRALVLELVARGQLPWDNKHVCVEESLAIFLYICGHSQRHRMAADRFQRSTSTISTHFKLMRRSICNLAPHIIRPPDLHVTPSEILHDDRYFPWFQDCVGAIDGTHIQAWVPRNRQVASRGRKPAITQNVMAVCSFDMKFTYVYPGWEGSAHDGRVFSAAVSNPANNFPFPPINKYYVVDAGYTNMPGYLAPYRGRRYHRDEFNGVNTRFRTPMELFNYKHSSLRNVIERCFGVLKGRFPILKHMPNYPEARQPGIVTACCVIHNFILITKGIDEFFEGFTDPQLCGNDNQGNVDNVIGVTPIDMSPQNIELMAQRREQMALAMWESHAVEE